MDQLYNMNTGFEIWVSSSIFGLVLILIVLIRYQDSITLTLEYKDLSKYHYLCWISNDLICWSNDIILISSLISGNFKGSPIITEIF